MNGKDMLNGIRKMDDKYIEASEGYQADERMIHEAMKDGSHKKAILVGALAFVLCAAVIVAFVIKPGITNEKTPTDNIGNNVIIADKENTENRKSGFTFNTKGFKEAYEKYCSLNEKSLESKNYNKYLLYDDLVASLGEPDIRYERVRGIDDDGVRNERNDIKYYVWTFDDGYRISACNGGNLPTDDQISYDYYTVYFECIFDGVKIEGDIDKLIQDEEDIPGLEDIINRIINRQSFDDEDYYKKTGGDGFCNFPYLYEYKTLTDKYTIQRFVDTKGTTESSDFKYPHDLIYNEEGHIGVYAVTSRNKNWDYYYLLAMYNHLDNHPDPAKNLIEVKNLLGEPDRIEDLNGKEVYCYILGEFTLKTYEGEERIVRKLIYNEDEVILVDGINEEEKTKPEQTQEPEQTKEPEPTKKPEQTKEPEQTQEPEQTKDPEPTKKPEQTKEPETTQKPVQTQLNKIPDEIKKWNGKTINPTIDEHDKVVSEEYCEGDFDDPAPDRERFCGIRFFNTKSKTYVTLYEDGPWCIFDGKSLTDSGAKSDLVKFQCSEQVNGAAYIGGANDTGSNGTINGIFKVNLDSWKVKRIIDTSEERVVSFATDSSKIYYVTSLNSWAKNDTVSNLKCYDIEKNEITCLISEIKGKIRNIKIQNGNVYFRINDVLCYIDPQLTIHVIYAGHSGHNWWLDYSVQEDKIIICQEELEDSLKGNYYFHTLDHSGNVLDSKMIESGKEKYEFLQTNIDMHREFTLYKGKLFEYNKEGFSLYDLATDKHEQIIPVTLNNTSNYKFCALNVNDDKLYIFSMLTNKLYVYDGKTVKTYDAPKMQIYVL